MNEQEMTIKEFVDFMNKKKEGEISVTVSLDGLMDITTKAGEEDGG